MACHVCGEPSTSGTITEGLCAKHAKEYIAEAAAAEVAWNAPPCQECGAGTPEEASTLCRCAGDHDWCHGQRLWPDE